MPGPDLSPSEFWGIVEAVLDEIQYEESNSKEIAKEE